MGLGSSLFCFGMLQLILLSSLINSQYRENPSYQLYLAPEPPVTTPLPTATEGEREKTPEEIENERALRERIDKQREVEAQLPKPKELSAIFTDQYLYERRNLLAAILNELGTEYFLIFN